ncbi:MAG: hypothetical protein VX177_00345 [Candidatus Neomarinimicrobiota bacterium]|nr:hypothetical protein [Candidatus Neomarinimicrobiota bacterium]
MKFFYESVMRNFFILMLSVFSVFFVIACEDSDDDAEEHVDAEGFILETEDGVEAYREFKGTVTGSVSLSVNDTLHFMVHFLDDDGKEIEHEEEHDDHGEEEAEIKVSGFNASVAKVEMIEEEGDDHGDDHGDEHEEVLQVVGVSKGSTSFKLELMHDGHADYTSTNNVPVTVN